LRTDEERVVSDVDFVERFQELEEGLEELRGYL